MGSGKGSGAAEVEGIGSAGAAEVEGIGWVAEGVEGTGSGAEEVEGIGSVAEGVEGTGSGAEEVEGIGSGAEDVQGTGSGADDVDGTGPECEDEVTGVAWGRRGLDRGPLGNRGVLVANPRGPRALGWSVSLSLELSLTVPSLLLLFWASLLSLFSVLLSILLFE